MNILEYNIFGKKLSEVTPDDVRSFCQKQNREGLNLDYKKDFSSPKKIAKTIAAMANTLGGWIIIGVADDGNDKPELPVEGIGWEKQLSLRITNLIIDNISPYVQSIVHVCDPDKDNKTFVILHVQESKDAPHWLFNENKLFIRLADRTSSGKWERLASDDEWEYIRHKREKALQAYEQHRELLDDLFDAYDEKSENEYKQNKIRDGQYLYLNTPRVRMVGQENTEDKINIVISPKYPTRALFSVEDAFKIIESIKFHDAYGTSRQFPFQDENLQFETFQKGIHIYFADQNRERVNFFALHQFGMFSFKQNVLYANENSSTKKVFLEQLLVQFEQNLLFAKNLYSKINYLGIINIDVLIDGEAWMDLIDSTLSFPSLNKLQSPLSIIKFKTDTSLTELKENSKVNEIVQAFYIEIANSFRCNPIQRHDPKKILKRFNL